MNEIKLKGKLIKKLEPISGTAKNGTTWNKQEFVIETQGDYPKKICISTWNDTIDYLDKAKEGDIIELSVDIQSREYNDKYYTDIKAWRIDIESTGHVEELVSKETTEPEDDLPF